MKTKLAPILCAATILGGCAGRQHAAPAAYQPARLASDLAHSDRTAATQMPRMPLPPPGQLLPIPSTRAQTDKAPPTKQVEKANRKALREPRSDGYVNAVQVYPWSEGAVYRLYAAPEQVSDIALEPGERLVSVAAGDTVRWIIGDTNSGSGAGRRRHILVKPSGSGLKTNLLIATDRRTYHLQLESTATTAMAAVSWTYPEEGLLALRGLALGSTNDHIPTNASELSFNYAVSGDRPPWRPLRAFDDGRQVFIEFPADLGQMEAPPLFVLATDGSPELVNYRIRGSYYIVDKLFEAAELRMGKKRQQVVRIRRTNENARGIPSGGRAS